MNPILMGTLIRAGLNILAGVLGTHTAYQVSQPEVDLLVTAAEGAAAAVATGASVVMSVKSRSKKAKK